MPDNRDRPPFLAAAQARRFRDQIQVSIDQYERGEFREYSQELLDQRWDLAVARFTGNISNDQANGA